VSATAGFAGLVVLSTAAVLVVIDPGESSTSPDLHAALVLAPIGIALTMAGLGLAVRALRAAARYSVPAVVLCGSVIPSVIAGYLVVVMSSSG
jgi:hypothetical protein